MAYVILCMIVKNEEKVIDRCLDSVLPGIDAYVICDTGSTDSTVEKIKAAGARHNKPGVVLDHTWKNFGYNRTLSARSVANYVDVTGIVADTAYALFMDADMVLKVNHADWKNNLAGVSYMVEIEHGPTFSYKLAVLARMDRSWESVGVTHEYWQPSGARETPGICTGITINHVGDGGSKADKFVRDIALLEEGVKAEPHNTRYMFYLAQSYKDVGDHEKSLYWYGERVKRAGWQEEQWYAQYQMGVVAERMGMEHETIAYSHYFTAGLMRPYRAEPFYRLSMMFSRVGNHEMAFLYGRHAMGCQFPKDDVLFIESDVYSWRAAERVAISAYYIERFRYVGQAAVDFLLDIANKYPTSVGMTDSDVKRMEAHAEFYKG